MTTNLPADIDGTVRLVNERLEFVSIISNLRPHFLNHKLIRHTPEGGWTHPWIYFDSLRNYLLLTCFDLLGQPSDYLDFQSWLRSSSKQGERDAIVASLDKSGSEADIAIRIHRAYLDIYGTKTYHPTYKYYTSMPSMFFSLFFMLTTVVIMGNIMYSMHQL